MNAVVIIMGLKCFVRVYVHNRAFVHTWLSHVGRCVWLIFAVI